VNLHSRFGGVNPKQERSRHTLHRLLSATEALLEHGGLEAATVPAIAKAAGLSVGVVYRRFPDKDMLLREVYGRFFESFTHPIVQTGHAKIREVIVDTVATYRRKRGLVRALILYARTHPDAQFRDTARRLHHATLYRLKALLLSEVNDIKAIDFAIAAAMSILQNAALEEHWPQRLDEELARLIFRYLGIKETP
jgi:AcrR family transcriptional regulator